ncbi:hypothetical protein, partial [Slackia piriformis]|uniref:hypothetical protein n=1 Tax=Slackia piriformis TaxID=626934 RepID=UPI002F952444
GQSPSLSRIAVRSGRLRRLLAGTAYTNIRDTTEKGVQTRLPHRRLLGGISTLLCEKSARRRLP